MAAPASEDAEKLLGNTSAPASEKEAWHLALTASFNCTSNITSTVTYVHAMHAIQYYSLAIDCINQS